MRKEGEEKKKQEIAQLGREQLEVFVSLQCPL